LTDEERGRLVKTLRYTNLGNTNPAVAQNLAELVAALKAHGATPDLSLPERLALTNQRMADPEHIEDMRFLEGLPGGFVHPLEKRAIDATLGGGTSQLADWMKSRNLEPEYRTVTQDVLPYVNPVADAYDREWMQAVADTPEPTLTPAEEEQMRREHDLQEQSRFEPSSPEGLPTILADPPGSMYSSPFRKRSYYGDDWTISDPDLWITNQGAEVETRPRLLYRKK
jgi:hypothetical protein